MVPQMARLPFEGGEYTLDEDLLDRGAGVPSANSYPAQTSIEAVIIATGSVISKLASAVPRALEFRGRKSSAEHDDAQRISLKLRLPGTSKLNVQFGSTAFAVLLALYEAAEANDPVLTETQLRDRSQSYNKIHATFNIVALWKTHGLVWRDNHIPTAYLHTNRGKAKLASRALREPVYTLTADGAVVGHYLKAHKSTLLRMWAEADGDRRVRGDKPDPGDASDADAVPTTDLLLPSGAWEGRHVSEDEMKALYTPQASAAAVTRPMEGRRTTMDSPAARASVPVSSVPATTLEADREFDVQLQVAIVASMSAARSSHADAENLVDLTEEGSTQQISRPAASGIKRRRDWDVVDLG
jgi:hypothetical protein